MINILFDYWVIFKALFLSFYKLVSAFHFYSVKVFLFKRKYYEIIGNLVRLLTVK